MGEVSAGRIGGRIFVIGAGDDGTAAYDMSTRSWDAAGLAQRPFLGDHHAAEVYKRKWYVFGGCGASPDGGCAGPTANKVQIYDPAENRWSLGADIPFGTSSASTAQIGDKIYLAGGIGDKETTSRAAVYTPATNSWREIAPMPQGRNHAAAGTDGKRLFVVGGRGHGSGDANTVADGFNTLQIYDPKSNRWDSSDSSGSKLAPLPQARGGMGKAVFSDGELYVFGGETSDGAGATQAHVYNRVDIYDPAANRWRAGASMPTARHGIFPILVHGRIHVIGGGVKAGASASAAHEVYRPR